MDSVLKYCLIVTNFVAYGFAWAELVDRIAAVVNDDIVPLSKVEARAAPELFQLDSTTPAQRSEARRKILKRTLDTLIGEKLMDAQIRELGIKVTDAEVDLSIQDVQKQNNVSNEQFEQLLLQEGQTPSSYRTFMRRHLARMKLVNLKVRSRVKATDAALKAAYKKWVHDEAQELEVHARHILVQVGENATPEQVAAARAQAGKLATLARMPGVNFAELAKSKSEGPSAADGGDLGFFRRGIMVKAFDRVAFNTKLGGISDPVRTKFGWHIIYIEERRTPTPPPFDKVKATLKERIIREQLEKYTKQYVQELRANALVDVKL